MKDNKNKLISANITYGNLEKTIKPRYNKDGKKVRIPPVDINFRHKYKKRESPKDCFDWCDYSFTVLI